MVALTIFVATGCGVTSTPPQRPRPAAQQTPRRIPRKPSAAPNTGVLTFLSEVGEESYDVEGNLGIRVSSDRWFRASSMDRLGRDLRHLINTVHDLTARSVGLKVLTGHGAAVDTTTAAGKLVFGIFAALAEFERELISERTVAGLISARARGRKGGRPFKMTAAKLRLAMASMGQPETKVGGSVANSDTVSKIGLMYCQGQLR